MAEAQSRRTRSESPLAPSPCTSFSEVEMEQLQTQRGGLHFKTKLPTQASKERLRSKSSTHNIRVTHGCTDTLCRLRCEIINRGPDEAWRRLPDFVMEISNFTQNPQYIHKYNHFMIHEIFRPHGVTNPLDFVVVFGRAALRLGSFASTEIGSAAIRDLFTSPYFPQLTKESIRQGIELWRKRADRTTDVQEGQGNMYEVSPSPVGRRVRFNSGIECEYTFDSLARTEAGRVALGLSISSNTLDGHRRPVFEIEEVEGDSGERPKGRWWNVLSFLLLCWRSDE